MRHYIICIRIRTDYVQSGNKKEKMGNEIKRNETLEKVAPDAIKRRANIHLLLVFMPNNMRNKSRENYFLPIKDFPRKVDF